MQLRRRFIRGSNRKRRSTLHLDLTRLPLLVGLLISAGTVLFAAGNASAQSSERITFDFTGGSSISLLGGTIVTPPDGTVDVGVANVFVEATAPSTYVGGGVFLLDGLSLAGTVSKSFGPPANVSGTYQVNQPTPLAGTLAPAMDGGDFTTDLLLDMNVQVGCTGTGCGSLGFPINDVGPSLLTVSFLPVSNLGIPGSAQINVSVPIEVDGVLGTLDLVGVEVARTFIPEPGTFVLVATGLGLLGVRGRGAKRR